MAQNRGFEVKVYVGIRRNTENSETPIYVVLDKLDHWSDLKPYRWFETTLILPLPQVAEPVMHDPVEEIESDG